MRLRFHFLAAPSNTASAAILGVVLLLMARLCGAQAAAGASAAPRQPITTLQANAHVVVVDVVVSDSKDHPVTGLNRDDFTVLEKGVPQKIDTFEAHTSAADAATPSQPMPKLPPNVFTNFTPVPPNGAVNVLLLDSLNTKLSDQAFVRQQMLKFLKEIKPGTRMAVFGLTNHLILLQGFTSDPELLKSIIEGKKNLPKQSTLLTSDSTQSLMDDMSSFGNSPGADALSANLAQFSAQNESFQTQLRTQYTLDAMNVLAHYLSGLPGRKNLIWFSGGFPLNILPDGDLANPFGAVLNSEDEFRETTDLLTAGQVAVYPVDAGGLVNNPAFSAASSGPTSNKQLLAANQKFFTTNAGNHITMDAIAQATGGHAFYNTNGLKQAVAEAIDYGSNYYTITYTPSNSKWDGSYRKVSIKVDKQGDKLAYRQGYYADDPSAPTQHTPGAPPLNSMQVAMQRGAPDPTQIIFKVLVNPTAGAPEAQAPAGNFPDAKLGKGPYKIYSINYAADARSMRFTATPDGTYHDSVDFTALLYDETGSLVNSMSNTIRADMDVQHYSNILSHGISFHQVIAVPAKNATKGNYFLRIGVHDVSGDKVGAVEVPIDALKEVAANAPAAASKK